MHQLLSSQAHIAKEGHKLLINCDYHEIHNTTLMLTLSSASHDN